MARIPQKLSKEIEQKFRVENNTLIRDKLPNLARRIEYEIGDIKEADFYPQFKTKHWDNECNFSVRLVEDIAGATVETVADKVIWKKPKIEAHFYEKPGDEDGQFEFEVLLKEKPASNVLQFSIQTKEFDFFYQPALTQEEIDEGAERPENVVGSYAVYHKTKKHNKVGGKEYRTGKAFHIYRPFVQDANGDKVWCDLNIDEQAGLLIVTIPQEFLDNGVYPLLVDPTFGYTTAGASESIGSSDRVNGTKGNPGESGTITSISAHIKRTGTGVNPVFKGGVYVVSDNSLLSPQGDEVVISNTIDAWNTSNVSSGPNISAQDYWASIHHNAGSAADILLSYDSETNASVFDSDTYSDGFPNPLVGTLSSLKKSIYATYTATSADTYSGRGVGRGIGRGIYR